MNDIKEWILLIFNSILLGFVGFFLRRYFIKNDEQSNAINEMHIELIERISKLEVLLTEMKTWTHEKFVSEKDFKSTINQINISINELERRFGNMGEKPRNGRG